MFNMFNKFTGSKTKETKDKKVLQQENPVESDSDNDDERPRLGRRDQASDDENEDEVAVSTAGQGTEVVSLSVPSNSSSTEESVSHSDAVSAKDLAVTPDVPRADLQQPITNGQSTANEPIETKAENLETILIKQDDQTPPAPVADLVSTFESQEKIESRFECEQDTTDAVVVNDNSVVDAVCTESALAPTLTASEEEVLSTETSSEDLKPVETSLVSEIPKPVATPPTTTSLVSDSEVPKPVTFESTDFKPAEQTGFKPVEETSLKQVDDTDSKPVEEAGFKPVQNGVEEQSVETPVPVPDRDTSEEVFTDASAVNDDDQWIDDDDAELVAANDKSGGAGLVCRDGQEDVEDQEPPEGERESGDGEEIPPSEGVDKVLDEDEDVKNPAYIPRKGGFFQHDSRITDEPVKETKQSKKAQFIEKVSRWGHDMFREEDQAPKSRNELVYRYGYDIRTSDNEPDTTTNFLNRKSSRGSETGCVPRVFGGRGRRFGNRPRSQSGGGGPRPYFAPKTTAPRDAFVKDVPPLVGGGGEQQRSPSPPRGPRRGGFARRGSDEYHLPPRHAAAGRDDGYRNRENRPRYNNGPEESSRFALAPAQPQQRGWHRGGARGGFGDSDYGDGSYNNRRQYSVAASGPPMRRQFSDARPQQQQPIRRRQYSDDVEDQRPRRGGGVPQGRDYGSRGNFDRKAPSNGDEEGGGRWAASDNRRPPPRNAPRGKAYSSSSRSRHAPDSGSGLPPTEEPDDNLPIGWEASREIEVQQQQPRVPETGWGDGEPEGYQPGPHVEPQQYQGGKGGFGRQQQGRRQDGGYNQDHRQHYEERYSGRNGDYNQGGSGRRGASRGGGGRYRGGFNDAGGMFDDYSGRPLPSMEFHRRRREPPTGAPSGRRGGDGDQHPMRRDRHTDGEWPEAAPPRRNRRENLGPSTAPRRDDRGGPNRERRQELPPRFQQQKEQYLTNAAAGDADSWDNNRGSPSAENAEEDAQLQHESGSGPTSSKQQYDKQQSALHERNRSSTRSQSPGDTTTTAMHQEGGGVVPTDRAKPKRYSATRQQQQAPPSSAKTTAGATGSTATPSSSSTPLAKDPSLVPEFTPGSLPSISQHDMSMSPPQQQQQQMVQGVYNYNGYAGPQLVYASDPSCIPPMMSEPYYGAQDPSYCVPRVPLYNPHGMGGFAGPPHPGAVVPMQVPQYPPPQAPQEVMYHQHPEVVYYDTTAQQHVVHMPPPQMRPKSTLPIVPPPDRNLQQRNRENSNETQ